MFIVPTLIAVAATTAVAIAVGTHHTPRHDTVVTTHSDVALPPDYASVSAADLAQRSFAIPGMKQAIVGVVVDELGSQQIGSGTDEDPTRIVTDYKMAVATAIAASGVVPASGTVTVRIPGGSIGSDSGRTTQKVDDAPQLVVGQTYVVWDQTQPATALSGSSADGLVSIPNNRDYATVSATGVVDWGGKQDSLTDFEAALTTGAHSAG
jgi:hypothetical protein